LTPVKIEEGWSKCLEWRFQLEPNTQSPNMPTYGHGQLGEMGDFMSIKKRLTAKYKHFNSGQLV